MNPQYYKEEEIDAMFAGFNPPIPTLDEVLNAGSDSDYRIFIETSLDRAITGNSVHPTAGIGVYGYSNMGVGVHASSDEGIGLTSLGKTNSAIFDMLGESNINDIVKFQNDGVNKVIIKSDGRITASPATLSNEVVVKSQLETASRPYKVYTALLTQSGTNAPTAIVLENTLGGTIVWSRTAVGEYLGTLTGAFILDKTIGFVQSTSTQGADFSIHYILNRIDNNSIYLSSFKANSSSTRYDDIMFKIPIEIRVYNEPI